jgi:2,5-diketo-D-gluconate reductase A
VRLPQHRHRLAVRNEAGVGEAIATCGIPREDLFVTTKLWNDDQGYESTFHAFEASLRRLRLDYVDLYLIHWPKPAEDRYVDTWRAFEKLYADRRVRAIGVSNFQVAHLQRLLDETDVVPAVNQIELHLDLQQAPLRRFHARRDIVTEAWSPLGEGRASATRSSSSWPAGTAGARPRSCSAGMCSWATSSSRSRPRRLG